MLYLKNKIKVAMPVIPLIKNRINKYLLDRRMPEDVFTNIYKKNKWKDPDSASGTGSNLTQTANIRKALPAMLKSLDCRILLDLPCGDVYWMRELWDELAIDTYIGGDIVGSLVEQNQQKYSKANRLFIKINIIEDKLPPADIVLCRDCLVHLSNKDMFLALNNIKSSGIKYLLTTTYDQKRNNGDIGTGDWRAINLEAAPFNFPSPLLSIDEGCMDYNGKFSDKKLGLWRLENICLS